MNLADYLVIIPARSGSKRLPGKNFKDFCGKPLWRWALDCARDVGFQRIVISSDAAVPPCTGANHVSFWERRPEELCSDEAPVWWTVEYLCYTHRHFGPVILLQPTSPLRTSANVLSVVREFESAECQMAFSTDELDWDMGSEPNGGVYVAKWKGWDKVERHHHPVKCYCGPDINTQEDWDKAEAMMKYRLNREEAVEAGP